VTQVMSEGARNLEEAGFERFGFEAQRHWGGEE